MVETMVVWTCDMSGCHKQHEIKTTVDRQTYNMPQGWIAIVKDNGEVRHYCRTCADSNFPEKKELLQ